MAVEILTLADYEEKIEKESSLVILDFWKEGCGPCKALSAELASFAEENPDIKIYSVKLEDETELVEKYHVMAAPTLLIIKDGTVKKKALGYKSKASIQSLVEIVRSTYA